MMNMWNTVKGYGSRAIDAMVRNEAGRNAALTAGAIGLPAVGLLGLTGDTTGEKIGGLLGGATGLGIEAAAQAYGAAHGHDLARDMFSKNPNYRRSELYLLAGVAPIAAEMIGSGIGGMIDPVHRQM